ncbi:hypothetical protein SK128_016489 [Halocaridina rubra]|uniref:Uncharacterized protein n=1 Tax=Halocaridina rubra TaxID=373956 RepID=A0AAN8XRA1_HALRR
MNSCTSSKKPEDVNPRLATALWVLHDPFHPSLGKEEKKCSGVVLRGSLEWEKGVIRWREGKEMRSSLKDRARESIKTKEKKKVMDKAVMR